MSNDRSPAPLRFQQLNVREHDGGVSFELRVQPRASRDALVGLHGDALKVALRAAPVDGAANEALLDLLADALTLPRRALRLLRGERSRTKIVHVTGIDPAGLCARLERQASDQPS
jgi:uncharacterized protein (TIGR00251 family)